MNKHILAIMLVVLLVTIAVFYFMSNEAVAPTETEDTSTQEAVSGEGAAVVEEADTPTEEPVEVTRQPTPTGNDAIIGMTTAEAQVYAETNGFPFRIGAIDGEFLPVTMDYRIGRITAEINEGIVTGYSVEE